MLPIMCVAQYKRCELKMEAAGQTQRTLPALTLQCIWDINNELCFGCYDNGSFITFKPRRDTQLVRAAQAVGRKHARIGSPRLPRPIIPPPATHPGSLSRFTGGPPLHMSISVFIRQPFIRI